MGTKPTRKNGKPSRAGLEPARGCGGIPCDTLFDYARTKSVMVTIPNLTFQGVLDGTFERGFRKCFCDKAPVGSFVLAYQTNRFSWRYPANEAEFYSNACNQPFTEGAGLIRNYSITLTILSCIIRVNVVAVGGYSAEWGKNFFPGPVPISGEIPMETIAFSTTDIKPCQILDGSGPTVSYSLG